MSLNPCPDCGSPKHCDASRCRGCRDALRHTQDAVAERFWAKVDRSGGTEACWPWMASLGTTGYGQFQLDGTMRKAHRVAYELAIGPIPEGLTLDHLCRNPPCVNPAHLEPVTNRENILRGISPAATRFRQTHCKRGHEFTLENTAHHRRNGLRYCRECRRASQRVANRRLAAAA